MVVAVYVHVLRTLIQGFSDKKIQKVVEDVEGFLLDKMIQVGRLRSTPFTYVHSKGHRESPKGKRKGT